MTDFIGLSFTVCDSKLCAIATSTGYALADREGVTTRGALAFLASLISIKGKGVFVCFDSAVDFELLLRDLTVRQKNNLFGVTRRLEEQAKDTPLYMPPPRNGRETMRALGYTMSMLPGKIFYLAQKKRKSLTVFDIESFFGCGNLRETVKKFLDEDIAESEAVDENDLIECGLLEARYIAALARKVEVTIEPLDLKIRQWYGPSAIAARCLTKWGARKEAKKLHGKNSASELLHAIDCALFGGRAEQVITGTIKDVRTFDLNSAYAYAVTLLSQFYNPLRFSRRFEDHANEPFSLWLVDYDLPKTAMLGVLPTRAATDSVSYRGCGRGYFWQPEVDYLRRRYPESFSVKWGYVGPYKQVSFAPRVVDLYEYRRELQKQGDKGEGIIKGALVNLYGKFAQNTGSAYFQCRAWAGWITSFVRSLLLDAVTGIEDRVISFNQDAVHLAGVEAAVDVGSSLGQWKRQQFTTGFYMASGFQRLYNETGQAKTATRGVNLDFDWMQIGNDLSTRHAAQLERSFFVGWQLSQLNPGKYGQQYLSEVREALDFVPSRLQARNYISEFDWLNDSRSSTINRKDAGMSKRYVPRDPSSSESRLKLRIEGRTVTRKAAGL